MAALVIETSTAQASLAVVTATGIEQRAFSSDRSHNALLFQPLGELLAGHPPLELVLVGSGPGSYSGTRVGIAAAQGVAIAMGCPAVAVPSILAVPAADQGARCLAIGDARRGSYWTARIEGHQLLHDPELCDQTEFLQRISAACQAGEAVFGFENPARLLLPAELADQVRLETPDATRLWLAWQATPQEIRAEWARQIPQPLYLKPPHITQAKRPWLVPQA
jgi:tRNA threonylcarbamoyl adenosine modification protein YeaZ